MTKLVALSLLLFTAILVSPVCAQMQQITINEIAIADLPTSVTLALSDEATTTTILSVSPGGFLEAATEDGIDLGIIHVPETTPMSGSHSLHYPWDDSAWKVFYRGSDQSEIEYVVWTIERMGDAFDPHHRVTIVGMDDEAKIIQAFESFETGAGTIGVYVEVTLYVPGPSSVTGWMSY